MTLSRITKIENSSKLLVIILFLIVFLYGVVLTPLLKQNEQKQVDIEIEKELSLYLDMAQQELSSQSKFRAMSQEQASFHLESSFNEIGVKLNSLNILANAQIVNISKISFAQLLDVLQKLKNEHGVVVVKADIELIESGLVKAKLTFHKSF